ncbi:hypothetical protein ACIRP2_15700 [Streptomyces sp. NPDC101194]|uniref:hypothetical protein n=1 Tax=Streptomyces sp. NPDC101194 TaxID=3366127 RepID=UPI0037F62B18
MDSTAYRYHDRSALFVNCTRNRSPEASHAEGLVERSRAVMAGLDMPTPRARCGSDVGRAQVVAQ